MKKIVPYLFSLLPVLTHAQNENDFRLENYAVSQLTLDAGLSGLQPGYEFVAGRNQTFQFRAGVAPVVYDLRYYGAPAEIGTAITASAEYRVYINFEKRMDLGKKTHNNGADYLGLLFIWYGKPLDNKETFRGSSGVITLGPVYGLNRPIGKRLLFHFSMGPAIQHQSVPKYSLLTIHGDLSLCFKITR